MKTPIIPIKEPLLFNASDDFLIWLCSTALQIRSTVKKKKKSRTC